MAADEWFHVREAPYWKEHDDDELLACADDYEAATRDGRVDDSDGFLAGVVAALRAEVALRRRRRAEPVGAE